MADKPRLRGNAEELSNMFVNLIDEFLDEFPETPMQTLWTAIESVKSLYNPGEADEGASTGSA